MGVYVVDSAAKAEESNPNYSMQIDSSKANAATDTGSKANNRRLAGNIPNLQTSGAGHGKSAISILQYIVSYYDQVNGNRTFTFSCNWTS
jgi:hypothetical protein